MLFALRPAGANDLELITRANPISDTPQSAPGFNGVVRVLFSEDERYLVFTSLSPNLSPGQINSLPRTANVFLWDRLSGEATLVSHAAGHLARTGNGVSHGDTGISADGRFVAFASTATDLVAGQIDTPGTTDLFFWDRSTGNIRLVSHAFNSAVTAGDQPAFWSSLSADGRFIVFQSDASNFLPGTGGASTPALYLWDRDSGALTLISHRAGAPTIPAAGFFTPLLGISADGGAVVYRSTSAELVAGQVDGGSTNDIFHWTRATGENVLVSRVAGTVATAGSLDSNFPTLSRDGRFVAYLSNSDSIIAGGDGNGTTDVYLFDRATGTNTLVSHANGLPNVGANTFSSDSEISADGSSVLFTSGASNLVPGQTEITPGSIDVFLWRRALDQTILVSHRSSSSTAGTSHGATARSISADGRFVSFLTAEPDLIAGQNDPTAQWEDAFLFDRDSGVVSLISHRSGAVTTAANNRSVTAVPVSRTGSYATFTTLATDVVAGLEDWNSVQDLFLYDRVTTENRLITRHAPGAPSSTQSIAVDDFPSRSRVSADGRWVALESSAPNLAAGAPIGVLGNVFLVDRSNGAQVLISGFVPNPNFFASERSQDPTISADGRFVAYLSNASNLVPGQVDDFLITDDVFLFDREANTSTLVSHRAGQPNTATPASHGARDPRISTDGRFVAYYFAGPLISGQSGPAFFLYDRSTGTNTLVSHFPGFPESLAAGTSDDPPALSADGRYVVYTSRSDQLVTGISDDTSSPDVFLFDRATGENLLLTRRASSPGQAAGGAAEPTISADGRYVAYTSSSPDLAPGQVGTDAADSNDVFLWDRTTATTRLVSHIPSGDPGDDASSRPAISADGRYVAFLSKATDLVANQIDSGDTPDAFLFDRDSGAIVLASHASGLPAKAVGAADLVGLPALSADGNRLAFATDSAEVIAGQTGPGGLFVYDRGSETSFLASHRPGDAARPGNAPGFAASWSADGSVLSFSSAADDLVANDYNWATDVFVHTTSTGASTGAYFTVPPCRLLDTRAAGQTPALASAAIRAATVSGRCGVPPSAQSIAVTLTVTGGTGGGFLSLFPANLPPPATAALNFSAFQTRSSNAIASLATNGAGTLGLSAFVAGGGTVEAIVDVFGYFE
jgi:Tol biopolymer transport system component